MFLASFEVALSDKEGEEEKEDCNNGNRFARQDMDKCSMDEYAAAAVATATAAEEQHWQHWQRWQHWQHWQLLQPHPRVLGRSGTFQMNYLEMQKSGKWDPKQISKSN